MSHEFGFFDCDYCNKRTKVAEFDSAGGERGVVRACSDCLTALAQELREWKPKLVKKDCPFCHKTVGVMEKYADNPHWFCYRQKCWDELARRNRAGEPLPWKNVHVPEKPEAPRIPLQFVSEGKVVGIIEATGDWDIFPRSPEE
jgi:hypothetical protein